MPSNRVKEAVSCFYETDNCSQAIFSVYGQQFGIDRDTCLKITSGFSGGINRTGNVCGAVTGAIMVLGLKYGKVGTKDPKDQSRAHGTAGEFIKKFKDRNVTIICRELIDHDLLTEEDIKNAYKKGVFSNCPTFVKAAAEILEEML